MLIPENALTFINLWKYAVNAREIVSSPASLALALGLKNQSQLDELRAHPDFYDILEEAFTWMCADWYAQLRRPAREVNAQGIIYALKTMGYTDNPKVIERKEPFVINLHENHERI